MLPIHWGGSLAGSRRDFGGTEVFSVPTGAGVFRPHLNSVLKLRLGRSVVSSSWLATTPMFGNNQGPPWGMAWHTMSARRGRRTRQSAAISLQEAFDEALLALRLSNLPLQLENTLRSRLAR